MQRVKTCKYCGQEFIVTKTSDNARKYCSITCRNKNKHNYTRISIRECAWCGKEYLALHDRHVSKFCSVKCAYYSKLDSNLRSVRKYNKKYNKHDGQAWLGSSYLKSHRNESFSDELKLIQNEFKRLKIKRMYK